MHNLADMRVTFVAGTLALGGAERQLFYMVQALRQAGTSVRVLSLTQGEFWETRLKEVGASVVWVGQEQSRARSPLSDRGPAAGGTADARAEHAFFYEPVCRCGRPSAQIARSGRDPE